MTGPTRPNITKPTPLRRAAARFAGWIKAQGTRAGREAHATLGDFAPRDADKDRAAIRRALSGKLPARLLKDIGGGDE